MTVTTRSQTKRSPSQKCLPIVTPQKVKGFKLMSSKMCGYNNFKYKKGKTYTLPDGQEPEVCVRGFHFCKEATDCVLHVAHLVERPLRLFEVQAQHVVTEYGKSAAKSITIGKEIKDLSIFDGPIQHSDGTTCTYNKNFRLHSENDQPAYVKGQYMEWYKDGVRHRDGDKPAIVYENGNCYYSNGIQYIPKLQCSQ